MVLCSRVAKAQRTKVGRQISRTTGYEIMHKKPRLGFRGSCTSVRFDLVSEFQSLTLKFITGLLANLGHIQFNSRREHLYAISPCPAEFN